MVISISDIVRKFLRTRYPLLSITFFLPYLVSLHISSILMTTGLFEDQLKREAGHQ